MDRTWGMEQTKQHHIHIYREERFANLYTVMKELIIRIHYRASHHTLTDKGKTGKDFSGHGVGSDCRSLAHRQNGS